MSGRNLKIMQYNVRKEKIKVLTPLLESEEVQDMDILAIQEPWFNTTNKSTYNPSHSKFHLVHQGKEGTRVCIYVNKRIDIDSWDEVFSGNDCCSIKIKLKKTEDTEEKIEVWVHNVYNPSPTSYKTKDSPSTIPVISEVLQRPGEHILVGDFNLHHPQWNNKGRYSYHAAADMLLETTEGHAMVPALPEGSVTWKARGSKSAIDLVFLAPGAHNALKTCRTREDLHYRSDHIPVCTELEWEWEEQTKPQRRAWKSLENEKTAKKVKEGGGRLARILGLPPLETTEAVNEYLGQMLDGFQEIIEQNVPWARPASEGRSFWDPACREAVDDAKKKLKDYHRYRYLRTEEQLRQAERRKIVVLQKAKTFHFKEALHKASTKSNGLWSIAAYGKNKSIEPKELLKFPLLKTSDGVVATTF